MQSFIQDHDETYNARPQACTFVSCACREATKSMKSHPNLALQARWMSNKKISAADRCAKEKNQRPLRVVALVYASGMFTFCKEHGVQRHDSYQNTAPMLSKFRLETPKVHASESCARQADTECAGRRPIVLDLMAGNDSSAIFLPKRAPPTELDRNF